MDHGNHYAWIDFHMTDEDHVQFDMDESWLPLRRKKHTSRDSVTVIVCQIND